MKTLFLSIFVLFSSVVIGQDHEYKIKENKLGKYATDLSLVLNPLFTDISNDNIVGGYSTDLLFRMNTIMSFRANYTGSYLNQKPEQVNKDNGGVYNGLASDGYVPFQYFHGEVTLYLYTDVYESNVKVGLPSQYRNGEKQNSYLELEKIDKMRQVGLRAGGGKYQGQLTEKGFEFHGVDETKSLADPTRVADLDNSLNNNYTTVSYDLISAGVSYESVSHLVVDIADSVGVKSKKSQWMIYGDALYGLNFELGDMKTFVNNGGNLDETIYSLGKFTEVAEIGFRVGFEHNITSIVGWSYGVEAGARPGTGSFGQRSYIAAKVGVSFNFKTLKY